MSKKEQTVQDFLMRSLSDKYFIQIMVCNLHFCLLDRLIRLKKRSGYSIIENIIGFSKRLLHFYDKIIKAKRRNQNENYFLFGAKRVH